MQTNGNNNKNDLRKAMNSPYFRNRVPYYILLGRLLAVDTLKDILSFFLEANMPYVVDECFCVRIKSQCR